MKDQMMHEGYTFDGHGNWTSPYSGKVTSYQPAREEFMIVQQLGGLVHHSPMDHLRTIRRLENTIRDLREQLKVARGGEPQPQDLTPYFHLPTRMPWEDFIPDNREEALGDQ